MPRERSTTQPYEPAPHWWRWVAPVVFILHLLITSLTLGLRFEHVLIDLGFIILAQLPGRWRLLSYRSMPFILTAVAYENFRYVKPLRGAIHVADLYHAEVKWFGVMLDGKRAMLPDYFLRYPSTPLDLICGFAYLAYLYEIVGLAIYLFFRHPKRMSRLAWGFLALNLMGMVTYLLYPAAPPWYVQLHGLGPAKLGTKPNAAGTLRFDELLGINYFKAFYSRNANVFGAMPSLHVAYPTLASCVVYNLGWVWASSTIAFAVLVAFSAIYLRHHYVWDVVFGCIFGLLVYPLMRWLFPIEKPAEAS